MYLHKLQFLFVTVISITLSGLKASPESCITNINNLLSTIISYQQLNQTQNILSLPIIAYSGKNLNDLGSYELCKRTANSSYITLHLEYKGDFQLISSFYLGICGPASCTAQDYQNTTVKDILQSSLDLASNITKYNISSLLTNVTITPKDPDGSPKLTFASWVAFLIVGTPILLVIASSIYIALRSSQKDNRNESTNMVLGNEHMVMNPDDSYRALKENTAISEKNNIPKAKILECWAIQRNIRQLFYPEINPKHDPNLLIFNGIRFLSMGWVILGHCYPSNFGYLSNYKEMSLLLSQNFMDIVVAGFFAVDTFFFLGGFFASYVLYSKLKSMKVGISSYGSVVIHRLIRILPAYVFVMVLYWKIAGYFGNGPLWGNFLDGARGCDGVWWRNVLFIESRFHDYGMCMLWGWYLSCDLNMFLACPIIVWTYLKSPRFGIRLIIILIIASLALGTYYTIADNAYMGLYVSFNSALSNDVYANPLVRAPPYLLGSALALRYRTMKEGDQTLQKRFERIRNSKMLSWVLELIGVGIISLIVWLPSPVKLDQNAWPNWLHKFYLSYDRFFFAVGLTFIVYPTLAGAKTLIRAILSAGFWAPLATLSFGMYLIHEVVNPWRQFTSRSTFYQDLKAGILDTLTLSIISAFAALIIYIIIEAPVANLENSFKGAAASKQSIPGNLKSSPIDEESLNIKNTLKL